MYSSKQNLKFPLQSHLRTPYSRGNNSASQLILSKILSKSRTSENNYGRSFVPTKPFGAGSANFDAFQDFDEPKVFDCLSEARRLSFGSRYTESVRNQSESEPVHFRPRKSQLGNKANENSFDNYIELKMMSLRDGPEVLENSKKSKLETGQEIQSKGFQIKARQNLLRIFTGSVENILHWSKLKNSFHILFEVTATIGVIQPGKWKSEKIFYLSDSKSGFRLQVVYHEIDRPLPTLTANSLVTCVGRLLTRNRLQAYKVEESFEEKKNDLQRLSFICNRVADELAAATHKK